MFNGWFDKNGNYDKHFAKSRPLFIELTIDN
jgi:hypothetical protein